MKFIKLALVFVSTFIIFGCAQLDALQKSPVMTLAPTSTAEPGMPTNTKWVFHTSTPEITDTPEIIIPTYAPIEGWQKIETNEYEVYLPNSYEGGSTDENVEQLIENFRQMGGEYKWYADTLEQDPDVYDLIATDTNLGPSGFITNLNISSEPILPTYSIEASMSSASVALPDNFQIVNQKMTIINGYEVGQIIINFEMNHIAGKELLYIIKGESTAWIFTFATGADEYNDRLLEFVQIIDSFRIK